MLISFTNVMIISEIANTTNFQVTKETLHSIIKWNIEEQTAEYHYRCCEDFWFVIFCTRVYIRSYVKEILSWYVIRSDYSISVNRYSFTFCWLLRSPTTRFIVLIGSKLIASPTKKAPSKINLRQNFEKCRLRFNFKFGLVFSRWLFNISCIQIFIFKLWLKAILLWVFILL